MKCSKCGAELQEDDQFCNKCGTKVGIENKISESNCVPKESNIEEQVSSGHEKNIGNVKKTYKNNIRRILVISLILVISIIGIYFLYPIVKYNNALYLLNSKNYNQAISSFEGLGKYKDSPEQIKKCKYQQAKDLLDNKGYSEAMQIFSKLGDYVDSKNMLKESKYELAKEEISDTKYADVIKLLTEISDYKDSAAILQEAQYNLAYDYYNNGKYLDAIQLYEKLDDYKDSKEKLTQALYNDAVARYKSGDFSDAEKEFSKTSEVYADSKTYLSNLNILLKFQGTWEENETKFQKILSGWKVYDVCYPNSNKTQVYDFDYTLDDNKLTILSDDIVMLNGDQLIEKDYLRTKTYTKISSNKYIPESSPKPSIGMTAEEVRNSQWGEPEKINKTTTASTIHEQWVYSNNRYIYLDNGIVTAIQN